ncbi:MAG: YdcH family protein [Acidobacteria bacterium]|nr:YdcH family protein [Acidobacteriota bacterium]
MGMDLREVRDFLMATNDEFIRLAKEHLEYEQQLEELARRPYLTYEEEIQEKNLKKRKLSLKDRMEQIIQQYRKETGVAH